MMTNDLIRRMASYPGTCAVCHARFEAGTEIWWNKTTRATTHAEPGVCEDEMEVWEIEQAASEPAGYDLGYQIQHEYDGEMLADMLADEREAEHRANCDDPACLDNWDPREAELTVAYEDAMRIADSLLDQYDSEIRLRRASTFPKGIYRVSFDAAETDYVNVQIQPRPGGKNLDLREWRGAYVGKFLTDDLTLKSGKVLKAGTIDYALGVNPSERVISRVVRGLNILLDTADPLKYGESFAVAAQACMRCGHPLVDEQSRARLLGPECAKRMDR